VSTSRTQRSKDALSRAFRRSPQRPAETDGPALEDLVPPVQEYGPRPEWDGESPWAEEAVGTAEAPKGLQGAMSVLRRGYRESPELRKGFGYTVILAVALAGGRVLVPILIQQTIDKGLNGPSGFRPAFVYGVAGVTAAIIGVIYFLSRAVYRRMVQASENALYGLRVRTFAHIHDLSIADQTAEKRGAFVSRVTSDIDALGQFMEWGALSWFVSPVMMLTALLAMFVYSWQLTLIVVVVVAPLVLVLRAMQHGMVAAYDTVRTRVGEMLTDFSESVMGAAVVRAYGLEERTNRRVKEAIRRRYKAEIHANKYMASIFPMADLFGALAISAVVAVGATQGPGWGLSVGDMVAFLFLVNLFLEPLQELSESFDWTQQAIAAWRKVLGVADIPVDVVEPDPGIALPSGALSVRAQGVEFQYRDGDRPVLRGIDVEVAAGSHVAIVGETGCGKTTFAKLLSRLADPTAGRISVGDVDLREVSPDWRRCAVRMVPQDGFLWDTTVIENVRYGRPEATDAEVEEAFHHLGLEEWVASLPEGLQTKVGERGESLSVGERQLVSLVRAQLAEPGLLILDEATSAVDPETERVLSEALVHLSEGRTTVTIAHRLSTAESAELVLVFDRGRIVERGRHADLVASGGVYASLYESWLGNTRAVAAD
jgi:ATP-binding cassette, subfamily B, bacterial